MGTKDQLTGSVYVLSLGCARNLVDSEVLQGLLVNNGFQIADTPADADIAIVNTCGFIQDAKQESIDMLLRLAEIKSSGGRLRNIVVTGCLSQRYPSELMKEIKELDGVFGTSDYMSIPAALKDIVSGRKVTAVTEIPGFLCESPEKRIFMTPSHYSYLKIQEGCSNRCTYCIIPDLRGPLRSRKISSILQEAENIKKERDTKELIVVAQDTTAFGRDREDGKQLPLLLKELAPVMSDGWIRLLYTHPAHFTEDLISVIADHDNICKYVDLPVQHINDGILKKMNRGISSDDIKSLIKGLRGAMEDIVLRTSIIVGFPGETDEQFNELLGFLEETKIERLGAFIYSPEEGTPASLFPDQVPEDVKQRRFDKVMQFQQKISQDNNNACIGRRLKVLIDEQTGRGKFTGRSYMDAPEVDGVIYVEGDNIDVGDFTEVKITGAMEYDLIGVKE